MERASVPQAICDPSIARALQPWLGKLDFYRSGALDSLVWKICKWTILVAILVIEMRRVPPWLRRSGFGIFTLGIFARTNTAL